MRHAAARGARRALGAALGAALVALVALVALAAAAGAQAPGAPSIVVQSGITVQPETVTVGDPFLVLLRIRAPLGATVEFPAGPDSLSKAELLDARSVRPGADSTSLDQTAVYRLAAWDVGDQPLRFGDIVVRAGDAQRNVSLGALQVHVRSVLPQDSAQRVPKPPRAIYEFPRPWWHWLLLALAILGVIGLLVWWWRRRKRPDDGAAADPLAVAEEEFARVEALGLLDAGERGRFVALMVEVMRHYLSARVDGAWTSLTSTELVGLLRRNRNVPVDRLAAVLAESDLVKFARRPVSADGARAIAREARAIVLEVDASIRREEEAARAAKAAMAEARGDAGKRAA